MPRHSSLLPALAVAVALLGLAHVTPGLSGQVLEDPRPLPEFTHDRAGDWLNSAPLSRADLRGSVVLLDVWAFECWNCYRSFPWLKSVERRFGDRAFRVIGIHTPEFDHERKRANLAAKIEQFGLEHPVMMDNDYSYWRALGNRYWPTFYIVDRDARIRGVFIGETHEDERQARAIEALIQRLLDES